MKYNLEEEALVSCGTSPFKDDKNKPKETKETGAFLENLLVTITYALARAEENGIDEAAAALKQFALYLRQAVLGPMKKLAFEGLLKNTLGGDESVYFYDNDTDTVEAYKNRAVDIIVAFLFGTRMAVQEAIDVAVEVEVTAKQKKSHAESGSGRY